MKRFFMCCIVVIVALFLGFTAYYFVVNKEKIALASENASTIKLNKGDTLNMNDIIKHEMPSKNTVIGVSFSVDGILSYNQETQVFTAEEVGSTVVTLTPSNSKFGPFVLNANVGDGRSAEFPYYIRTSSELASIGKTGSTLTTSMSYELISDIYLTDMAWSPIALGVEDGFTGSFNGANHVIYDMTINQSGSHAGLFAKIGKGVSVQGITFVRANLTGDFTYAGVVAGESYGTISLCHVIESSITNGGNATGGIVGYNRFTQVANGGISGRVGMCGVEDTNITAAGDVGGIVGYNDASIVENCYAVLNSVNGSSTGKFGGVVGNNVSYKGSFDKVSTIYKSYAYVKSASALSVFSGLVAVNTDVSTSIKNQFVNNIFVAETDKFVGSQTSALSTEIVKKSAADLKNQATYQTWDFNRVWKMSSDYAVIDFNSSYTTNMSDTVILPDEVYPSDPEIPGGNGGGSSSGGSSSGGTTPPPSINPGVSGSTITSSNVWQMLKQMHDYPNSGKVYTFNTSFDVYLNSPPSSEYQNLFPLGTKEKPFTCTIAPPSMQQITFKNLSVNGKPYSSFFGYVGTGAAISGIVLEGANVTGDGSTPAGILAGEVQIGGLVANCEVKTSSLTGNGNIGLIAGYNAGTVMNCVATMSNTINTTAQANAGGIVGYNNGSVSTPKSVSTTISAGSSGNIGGIVGYNNGSITSAVVTSNSILGGNKTGVYAGGIAGQNLKTISSSKVTDSRIEVSMMVSSCYVGGITAVNIGSITKSAVLSTTVVGYYAGGLAGMNMSNISQSTSGENNSGKVTGVYAGGLTSVNAQNATITNCLVGTQMVTTTGSLKTCGFAYKLEGGSVIKNCFSYAIFSGNDGEKFCDTDTPFRNFFATNIWQNTPIGYQMGKVEDSLMCNLSNTKIYGNGLVPEFFDSSITDVQVTEQEAKGSDNWAKFFDNNFDFSIWKRVNGQFLSLR